MDSAGVASLTAQIKQLTDIVANLKIELIAELKKELRAEVKTELLQQQFSRTVITEDTDSSSQSTTHQPTPSQSTSSQAWSPQLTPSLSIPTQLDGSSEYKTRGMVRVYERLGMDGLYTYFRYEATELSVADIGFKTGH